MYQLQITGHGKLVYEITRQFAYCQDYGRSCYLFADSRDTFGKNIMLFKGKVGMKIQ